MIRAVQRRKVTPREIHPRGPRFIPVDDVHNYQALVRFGFVGIALTGLGLIGCLVHRQRMRLAVSFAVALTGCLLVFDAAARFHLSQPQLIVSAVIVGIGAAGICLARWRGAERL